MVNKMPWTAIKKQLENQISTQEITIQQYENGTKEILEVC